MKLLHISSTEISKYLHVDASLISKWKSGTRQVTPKSSYYSEVVEYLLKENRNQGDQILQDFLDSVYPDNRKENSEDVRYCIMRFLGDTHIEIPKLYRDDKGALYTAEISIYNENNGRRNAISQLLKVAEQQEKAGKMITIDCEQFQWLVEEEAYAVNWSNRMYQLLERGYKLEVIIHFSLYQENFIKFFLYCNKVLFHKNTTVYYHKYFDEDIYWFSFFCLEHAMSVMGLSMTKGQSDSTVFTDAFSIMQHQEIVEYVKRSCNPMFLECTSVNLNNEITTKLSSVLYCSCKVPECLLVEEELLVEVLNANQIDYDEKSYCLKLRRQWFEKWYQHYNEKGKKNTIFFYSMEAIERYKNKEQILCHLLSFLLGKEVFMSQNQFQKVIENTKKMLIDSPNMLGCFLKEEEESWLPLEYCLYAQDMWIFSLNNGYAKIGKQSTLLDTATVIFEKAWRKVPTNRKI